MPHFGQSMARVEAWFAGAVIDRPPVRFMSPNYFPAITTKPYQSLELEDKWFDAEFRVDAYLASVSGVVFPAETFPFFYPFLGVDFYAALYGSALVFDDVTSWATTALHNWTQLDELRFDRGSNVYFERAEALTQVALERCAGKTLVGYTSLHPGVDAAAAIRGHAEMCLDLVDNPDEVTRLIDKMLADFAHVFHHFNGMLKERDLPSISWLAVPSAGTIHIPGCDFATLLSPEHFEAFCLPALMREVQVAEHNVFHLDGKGVARHIDMIMEVPGIDAIQWAQGSGSNRPILQWLPLIKKIQARYPVIVDLNADELDAFMAEMQPEGLYLWITTDELGHEEAILKRVEQWV